jgi:hypothetical protein
MITRVLICLRYNPSRGIGNSLILCDRLQDTRLFLEGPEYEVNASPLQCWYPSPTNGHKEDRYKKSAVSSEIARRRRAKISHYSRHRILFERQIHHKP